MTCLPLCGRSPPKRAKRRSAARDSVGSRASLGGRDGRLSDAKA